MKAVTLSTFFVGLTILTSSAQAFDVRSLEQSDQRTRRVFLGVDLGYTEGRVDYGDEFEVDTANMFTYSGSLGYLVTDHWMVKLGYVDYGDSKFGSYRDEVTVDDMRIRGDSSLFLTGSSLMFGLSYLNYTPNDPVSYHFGFGALQYDLETYEDIALVNLTTNDRDRVELPLSEGDGIGYYLEGGFFYDLHHNLQASANLAYHAGESTISYDDGSEFDLDHNFVRVTLGLTLAY